MEQGDLIGAAAMALKRCRDCKDHKPHSEYGPARENRDRMSTRCKACIAKSRADRRKSFDFSRSGERGREIKYAAEGRPWVLEKARRASSKKRARGRGFIDELKANPCMDCGGSFPPECMDFDHRDGESKKFCIGAKLQLRPDSLASEIAKCDLVCSNCHRIRTRRRAVEKRAERDG